MSELQQILEAVEAGFGGKALEFQVVHVSRKFEITTLIVPGKPSMRRPLPSILFSTSPPTLSSPSPPYQLLGTGHDGGQGRAGSARRKGSLDGRQAPCDPSISEAKEPDMQYGFRSPLSSFCPGFASRRLKIRPRGLGFHPHSVMAVHEPGAY